MTKEFVPKLKYLELLSEFIDDGVTTKDAASLVDVTFFVSQKSSSMALKRLVKQGCAKRQRVFEDATFEYAYFINEKGLGRMEWLQLREERSVPEVIDDLEDKILRLEMKKAKI